MSTRPAPWITHVGSSWTPVIQIRVPGILQYSVFDQGFSPDGGRNRIHWRRFSVGFPWYWESDFGTGAATTFSFVLTDIYVSLELRVDNLGTGTNPFLIQQIFP